MLRRRLPLLFCTAALMGSACDTPRPEPQPSAPAAVDAGPLPVARLAPGSGPFTANSGYTQHTTSVIRNAEGLAAAWATLHANQQPVPPLPAIDFSKEMIVVVATGTKPNGGFSVVVSSASESGGRVTVTSTETAPGATCAVPAVITAPADVARLPRRDGDVIFVTKNEVHAC